MRIVYIILVIFCRFFQKRRDFCVWKREERLAKQKGICYNEKNEKQKNEGGEDVRGTENLGTFCVSEDKKEMMRFLGCDEKYNQGRCSDFEFLAEWERILPDCVGSESARLYKKQLSFFGFSKKDLCEKRPSPIELWQASNQILTEEKKCYFTRKYQEMMKKQGIDVLEIVTNIINDDKSAPTENALPVKEVLSRILWEYEDVPQLRLDASSLCYARPDRYHATLAWQRFCRGEKLNSEERFVLQLQLLIEVLLCLKQKKMKAILHLVSDDPALVSQTVAYFKENHLMEGEIRFSLSLDAPASTWLPICRTSDASILVLPELVLRPSDLGAPLATALRSIASVYPIGGIRFGGLLTDSESLALVAKEEAEERMEEFLSSEGVCDEKRQEILNRFFN